MRQCHYCGWTGDCHDPNCPKPASSEMAEWRRSWQEGRRGCEPPTGASKLFVMGWHQGNIALEEAQNGFDPSDEGHQW